MRLTKNAMLVAKRRASGNTGVMSLNWMPGLGKFGIVRIAFCTSERVCWAWSMRRLLLHRFQLLDHLTQLVESNVLDLAHPFARYAKFFSHFFQRFLRAAVQSEAVTQDRGLARIQGLDHFLQHLGD